MIVFSAFLVVVAVGLLVAGVVTSKLAFVYVAIGVSGVSLLALGLGTILKRRELFGQAREAAPGQPLQTAPQVPSVRPDLAEVPQPAVVSAGWGWSAATQPAPPQAGYLPTVAPSAPPAWEGTVPAWESAVPTAAVPPAADAPPPAVERPRSPAQQIWEWRGNLPEAESERSPAATPASAGPFDYQPAAEDLRPADNEQPAPIDQATWELPSIEHPEPAPGDEPDAHVEEQEAEEPAVAEEPQVTDAVPEEVVEDSTVEDSAVEDSAVEDSAVEDRAVEDQVAGDQVAEEAPAEDQQQAPPDDAPEPAPAEVDLLREVTVVPGVPRYHSAQCILIRFMGEEDLSRMPLSEARQAGCTPCRACQPDQA